MKRDLLLISCLLICSSLSINALSQENESQNMKTSASVAGRVLLDGKPMAGANAAVLPERQNDFNSKPVAQTKTDAEGDIPTAKSALASEETHSLLTHVSS